MSLHSKLKVIGVSPHLVLASLAALTNKPKISATYSIKDPLLMFPEGCIDRASSPRWTDWIWKPRLRYKYLHGQCHFHGPRRTNHHTATFKSFVCTFPLWLHWPNKQQGQDSLCGLWHTDYWSGSTETHRTRAGKHPSLVGTRGGGWNNLKSKTIFLVSYLKNFI